MDLNAYGLTNYWPIKGNINDFVGTAHMIYGSNNSLTSDRLNNVNAALNFASGYNSVPPGVYFKGDFTISLWINFNQMINLTKIIEFSNNKTDLVGLYASINKTGLFIIKGSARTETFFTQTLQTNRWYHFTVTLCNTLAKVYIDGSLKASGTQQIPANVNRATNFVGGNSFGDARLNAKIDELRIYKRCLSQNEIMNLISFTNTSPDLYNC